MRTCENCEIRKLYAKCFDVHFDWRDCPYACEYAKKQVKEELTYTQQWVPLSTNQLPEEGQHVFIQFKEGRYCPHFKIQVGHLGEHDVEDNNFRKIGVKKVWYTNQYYYDFDTVIAWMPLPEPYVPERSEE